MIIDEFVGSLSDALDERTARISLAGILASGDAGTEHIVSDLTPVHAAGSACRLRNRGNEDFFHCLRTNLIVRIGDTKPHGDQFFVVDGPGFVCVPLQLDHGVVDGNSFVEFAEGKIVLHGDVKEIGMWYPFFAFCLEFGGVTDFVAFVGIDVNRHTRHICAMRRGQNNIGSNHCAAASANLCCSKMHS